MRSDPLTDVDREADDALAFQPATGAAFTHPYPGRTIANWVDFLEPVEAWLATESVGGSVIESTPIPVGTRVRLRPVHDFLTLQTNTATVLGPGDAPGLLRIRLDQPARCHVGDDDVHDVQEMSEAIEHLERLSS